MKRSCIVCGQVCKDKMCIGTKNGMQAVFCDEHSEYCDDCETMECLTLTD